MRRLWILAPVAAIALAGCQLLGPPPPCVLVDVPFLAQEEHQCGAAALGMVLAYWNRPAPTDALVDELYIPSRHGTPPALVIAAAQRRGIHTVCRSASVEDLIAALSARQPPIVFLAPQTPGTPGHFAVVTGMRLDGSAVRIHDPARPNVWWPADPFLRRWRSANHLTLFLAPAPPSVDQAPSSSDSLVSP